MHTALFGSVVIGAILRPGSAGHVDPVGPEAGDDAPHEGTAGLFARGSAPQPAAGRRGYVGAMKSRA
ncbi:hypothetical protein [Streptomyces sp. NPDC050704]|uniref:hypothetical protein n=1 Tax=Streptomyces sp. NPDC050704 TaxID=3157219 RepID=UPI00343F85C5